MYLEQMKWREIDSLSREHTVAVCCISAMEQHSLHMPMGTDHRIGSEIVRRLEQSDMQHILCLPVVWFGASDHHMDFPGTISASVATMISVLYDIASSLGTHGFRKILFLNSHGGNRALLSTGIQDMGRKLPELTIVGATYWELVKDDLMKIRETGFGGMGHACELETSIALAAFPELVDMSRAKRDGIPAPSLFIRGEMLSAPAVARYRTMKQDTAHGGHGDPESATAEKGERMLEAIVAKLALLCQDLLSGKI